MSQTNTNESATNITARINVMNPVPNVDINYGPYASVHEAYETLNRVGSIAVGLTIGVNSENGIVEYWFKNGITENDLVIKGISEEFNTHVNNVEIHTPFTFSPDDSTPSSVESITITGGNKLTITTADGDFSFKLMPWEDNPGEYLKFMTQNGGKIGFLIFNKLEYELPAEYETPNIEYSLDDGDSWQPYVVEVYSRVDAITEERDKLIILEAGESVLFRGVNETLTYYVENYNDYVYFRAYMEGDFYASGDVTALLNGVGGNVPLTRNCYLSMFSDCTGLKSAPALPATTLADGCYDTMFQGCTGLTEAPALPATTLADYCYHSMFQGCTRLTEAPALPATTLADFCYDTMFYGCTRLTEAPALPATTLADYCYMNMFNRCTGLTTAPALAATTIAESCYSYMFERCTGLTAAPALPATTLADGCYHEMFYDCTSITSHDVATLNNSINTFYNNSSCALLRIHAETPPTIGDSTITGLKADCAIYVPDASVDAYKAKQYWSERAAYIREMLPK